MSLCCSLVHIFFWVPIAAQTFGSYVTDASLKVRKDFGNVKQCYIFIDESEDCFHNL
jgi:hypothetical protein